MAYVYADINTSAIEWSAHGINVVWWQEVRVYTVLWRGIMLFSNANRENTIARAKTWARITPQLHGTIRGGIPRMNDDSLELLKRAGLLIDYLAAVRLAEQDIAARATGNDAG